MLILCAMPPRISGVASAKLKLARIALHLDEINTIVGNLANTQDAYETVIQSDGKEKLHFLVPPPPELQIIAGEIIYQFRSALDHLAFDLVQFGGREPGRKCQFPLLLDVPTCGKPPLTYPIPVPKEFFEDALPGISDAAYAFIEGIQPYHRGPGIHNILRVIGTLANIDKHRHLYVLLSRASVNFKFTYSDGMLASSTLGGLQHGAEVPWLADILDATPPMDVKRSFTPYVTFDETIGAGPDTLETENLLEVCVEQFKAIMIPAFEKLIQ